jgi:hypothetical protein
MFSIVGGLLSTVIIAVATYVISAQPPPVSQTVQQSAIVKIASHPVHAETVRE